jgi:signal transduction histidine kinase
LKTFVTRIIGERSTLQRQYALAAALFGALVLAIILLFGHLISQSLSKRYLEDLFVTGREEAQRIATEVGEPDAEELEVFQQRQERLARTIEGTPQRHIFDRIVVTDRDGQVVYESSFEATEDVPAELVSTLELSDGLSDQEITETADSYQIVAPIGDVGSVVVSINRARVSERVGRLRRQLLGQTISVAVLTLATLVMAFVLVWHLIQRNRRLETKAREAEDFAALGTLAANLAHEIRNPLNSINLNLELLEEDLELQDRDVGASVASTRREVGRLASLVSDFLAYARPSSPDFEELLVAPLLQDVCDFLRAEARSLGVHLKLGAELPKASVTSDESQLRQVLLNLVLNAIQAVAGLEAERRVVELTAESADHEVSLVVRDRGQGIPENEMAQVRKAFYTRRRGGTGLGLAIAERFVEAHGGRIELDNLDPFGFEARIVLPITSGGGKMSGLRLALSDRAGRSE